MSELQADMEDGYLKRPVVGAVWEFTSSPQKKLTNIESNVERKKRMAQRLRGMNIKERCKMVERAIYAEDEFKDLPEEYQDAWQLLEAESEPERIALLARKEGKSY